VELESCRFIPEFVLLRIKVVNTEKRKKNSSLALNIINLVSPSAIRQTVDLEVHFLLMEKSQDIAFFNPGSRLFWFGAQSLLE